MSSGRKAALLGDGSAGDPQGGDEGHPVRVAAGVTGGAEHQGAQGVVAAQVTPDFLQHQSGFFERSTVRGPRWWVLISSKAVSISQRPV